MITDNIYIRLEDLIKDTGEPASLGQVKYLASLLSYYNLKNPFTQIQKNIETGTWSSLVDLTPDYITKKRAIALISALKDGKGLIFTHNDKPLTKKELFRLYKIEKHYGKA